MTFVCILKNKYILIIQCSISYTFSMLVKELNILINPQFIKIYDCNLVFVRCFLFYFINYFLSYLVYLNLEFYTYIIILSYMLEFKDAYII